MSQGLLAEWDEVKAPTSGVTRAVSPPTDRVVAIVEFLAVQAGPTSAATIATRLELNRSTVTAILGALERACWVERQPDRRYVLGAGLYGVAEAVRESMPLSDRFPQALEELAQRSGCDATLALVGGSTLTFLAVARGRGQAPAGVNVGVHLPLTPPLGISVIAHRDRTAQQLWLGSAAPNDRRLLDGVLGEVRQAGVAVFGLGEANPGVLAVLAEVAQSLNDHPRRSGLQQQVFELLAKLAGNPYTTAQLASTSDLSVSYLAAPVVVDAHPVYEIQLGPLQPAVSPPQRLRYIDEIRTAARALSHT